MMMWFFCTLSFIEKNLKEQVETMMRNRLADKRHRHLEKLLLSNPKEVKRLTELIILEQEVKQLSVRNLSLDSVYYIFCIMHADNQPVSNQIGILTQIKHLAKAFDSL